MNSEKRIQKTEVALYNQDVSFPSGKCPVLSRISHKTLVSEETIEKYLFRVSEDSVSRFQLSYSGALPVFSSRGGSIKYHPESKFSPTEAPPVLSLSTQTLQGVDFWLKF